VTFRQISPGGKRYRGDERGRKNNFGDKFCATVRIAEAVIKRASQVEAAFACTGRRRSRSGPSTQELARIQAG